MDRAELAAWLRLLLTPGVGRDAARRLLATFGLPQALFAQRAAALEQIVSGTQAQALLTEPDRLAGLLDATQQWLDGAEPGVARRIVTLGDADFPQGLLATEDPPLLLHLLGQADRSWPDAIAMVGSRNPTPQGTTNARQFGRSFAASGWTVVSGLALGIDGAAHEGALSGAHAGQLATIAVVGTGLDRVYPRQHHELARRIARQGLIVSEFPIGTPPLQSNFPMRNRIIAGLSRGTVVVEAALQSGSLITARQALEQGKEVFAIPGSIHATQSRGCHALLKQGAKLVETAQDVLEELLPAGGPMRRKAETTTPSDDADADSEDALLAALGFDPVGLDALVARTGIPPASLQVRLLEYELDGRVARLPGGLFQRVDAA